MEWIQKNRILWKKIGILIGVYLGMKYLVPLVIPFFIAAWIVWGCWPLLSRIRQKLHINPAIVMAFFLMVTAVLLLAGLYFAGRKAGGSVRSLWTGLAYQGRVEGFLYDCCDHVSEFLHLEPEGLRVFVARQINLFQAQAQQSLLPGAVGGSWQAVKQAGSWIAAILVTVVSILLLTADYEKLRETGKSWPGYEKILDTLVRILHSAGGYLRAQGILMGIVMGICMAGIGISGWVSGKHVNPVLAGVITGALDALPVLGTGIVFLPWVLLRIFQKEYAAAVVLAVTYGVCVLTRELLEPRLVGDRLGVLPIVILMSVYVGVKLYGFGGILLGPLSVLLVRELWRGVDEAGGEGDEKEEN